MSLDSMTAVEDMIFRDKVDVVYDAAAAVCSRRRRIEWPTLDPHVRDLLQVQESAPLPDITPEAKALVEEEIAKCDTRRGLIVDLDIYDELYVRTPNWRNILRALYFRARRQSAICRDTFELLVNRGFLHPRCLTIPVDLLASTPDTKIVARLLACFSHPYDDLDRACRNQLLMHTIGWMEDINWYA
jgi:hypothetical protein